MSRPSTANSRCNNDLMDVSNAYNMLKADLVSGLDSHIKQNKYEELRRKFSRKKVASKSDQLLFSLLYIAIMIDKVDDIKMMFRAEDPNSFSDWESVISDIHPPQFHIHERNIQNKRVKALFERKRYYKDRFEEICTKCNEYKDHASKLNSQANETAQSLAESIQRLSEEENKAQELIKSNAIVEAKLNEVLRKNDSQHTNNLSLQDELEKSRLKQSELVHQLETITERKREDESNLRRLDAEGNGRKSRFAALEAELKSYKDGSTLHEAELNATNIALQNSRQDLNDFKEILGGFLKKIEAQSCRDREITDLKGKLDIYGAQINSASHENTTLRRRVSVLESDITFEKETQLNEQRDHDEVRSALKVEVELSKHKSDKIAYLEAEKSKLEFELRFLKTRLSQVNTPQLPDNQKERLNNISQFCEERASTNEDDSVPKNDAAVLIQSSVRANIARSVLVKKKHEEAILKEQQVKAAVAIQCSLRASMAQRRLEGLKHGKVTHDADGLYGKIVSECEKLCVVKGQSEADDTATSVQSAAIGDVFENNYAEIISGEKEGRAAVVIQSSIRVKIARKRLLDKSTLVEEEDRRNAAIAIQSSIRLKLSRNEGKTETDGLMMEEEE